MLVLVPAASLACTRPRRLERSPITSPTLSSGTVTSTFMMGSSRVGLAFSSAALNPKEPASLKAISLESTLWCLPSMQRTRTSTTGKPARMPWPMPSRQPFSTAGIRLRGMAPPTISSTNSKPPPRGSGSIVR